MHPRMRDAVDPPRVLIATDVPFWREGRGDAARIAALTAYLGQRFRVGVIYLDLSLSGAEPTQREIVECSRRYRMMLVRLPATDKRLAHAGFAQLAAEFRPHACVIEHLRLSPLRHRLSPDVLTILDTHDIISDRNLSFLSHGAVPAHEISRDVEFEIFAAFDKVLLIQAGDHRKAAGHIGEDRAILAPHPVQSRQLPARDKARSIGLIASSYAPNREGLDWFIREVWPALTGLGLTLDIYGSICADMQGASTPGIHLHGRVATVDIAYRSIDIAINPVRFGAGLKIKNVEALARGLPLVTTAHSAMGLPTSEPAAFVVADSSHAFGAAIKSLAASTEQRQQLSDQAVRLAAAHFSPDACFAGLARCIVAAAGPGHY